MLPVASRFPKSKNHGHFRDQHKILYWWSSKTDFEIFQESVTVPYTYSSLLCLAAIIENCSNLHALLPQQKVLCLRYSKISQPSVPCPREVLRSSRLPRLGRRLSPHWEGREAASRFQSVSIDVSWDRLAPLMSVGYGCSDKDKPVTSEAFLSFWKA